MKNKEIFDLEQLEVVVTEDRLIVNYIPKHSKEHVEMFSTEYGNENVIKLYNLWLESDSSR